MFRAAIIPKVNFKRPYKRTVLRDFIQSLQSKDRGKDTRNTWTKRSKRETNSRHNEVFQNFVGSFTSFTGIIYFSGEVWFLLIISKQATYTSQVSRTHPIEIAGPELAMQAAYSYKEKHC